MLLPVLELCQSRRHDIWTVLILGYKGLLLLLGLFLAYETRQLKIRYLNDLKFTLLSICNVGVLCLLCGPIVVFFLRTQPNPFFCFVSTTVLVCTCVSMGLIYGPKLLFIYRNPELTKEERNNQFQESTASQAEQLRYQQLLKENAELKRQIDMRNIRIQECRRILEGHPLMTSPRSRKRHGANVNAAPSEKPSKQKGSKQCSSNAIIESSGMPSSSGILEFEPPTISSSSVIDGPTIVTFLETQQELSTDIDDDAADAVVVGHGCGRNSEQQKPMEEMASMMVEIDEQQQQRGPMAEGADTGVCSDYEEECDNVGEEGREAMLMTTDSSESLVGNGEDEEEIML